MTEQRPHSDEDQSSGAPLLGPAVSRGSDVEPRRTALDQLMGPFSGAPRPVSPQEVEEAPTSTDSTGTSDAESIAEALDLDWMSTDEPMWEEAPDAAAAEAERAPEPTATGEPQDLDWLSGDEYPWAAGPSSTAAEPATSPEDSSSGDRETPDWLESEESAWAARSEPDQSDSAPSPAEAASDALDRDWLSGDESPWSGAPATPQSLPAVPPGGPESESGAPNLEWLSVDDKPWGESATQPESEAAPSEAAASSLPSFLADIDETAVQEDEAWLELDEIAFGDESTEWLTTAGEASLVGETTADPSSIPALEAESSLFVPPDEEPDSEVVDEELQQQLLEAPIANFVDDRNRAASVGLDDVASRLERIARSLRDRSPTDLLADTSDPLQLLIVGYALGVAQSQRGPSHAAQDR